MAVELVLARYREDASWADNFAWPVTVYDKSGQPGPLSLPNIGRESHTYVTHIVRRYPEFPEYTVFVQADPFGHMGQGAGPETLAAAIERNMRLETQFTGLAWFKLRCDGLGRPHDMADPDNAGRWKGYGRDIPVGEVYAHLFDGPVPGTFLVTAPAGMLFVSAKRILARPLAFYTRCLRRIEADPEDAYNTGHAFERLWQIIFDGKTPHKNETHP